MLHKKLNHKYIIELIDFEVKDEKLIMLIEYAKHGDLFGLIRENPQRNDKKLLKIFYKII